MGILDALRRVMPGARKLSAGRALQEETDMSTLAVLMSVEGASKSMQGESVSDPAGPDSNNTTPQTSGLGTTHESAASDEDVFNDNVERVLEMGIAAHRNIVANQVEQQLDDMFSALERAAAAAATPSELYNFASETETNGVDGATTFDQVSSDPSVQISPVEKHLQMVESKLLESYGALPRIGPSSIQHPAAGDGVFLSGKAPSGRVVALYPGSVYLPFQVKRITDSYFRESAAEYSDAQQRFEDLFGTPEDRNVYATQLIDGAVINARNGSVSAKPNLYAVAHKVNHPPPGVEPNVMVCPFVFRKSHADQIERTGRDFRDYIPNAYFEDAAVAPSWWMILAGDNDVLMRSLAYVTTRPIEENEELFVNYRFDPNHQALPDWYTPVDLEEDTNRWS
ncbi:Hypothetical Protein FCC1311_010642 [Hondaea fermentalgiana]|uniref:SET domain-containing protein n=1 Tax=Hondaea fermentalgiana TaxID=2315210 RepID=A0A2R5G1E3_9STRA|nr:Hypothetical Protein FCC1311_010642 [Hondaea fermentalgiana]|eukprot:GBG24846.1 Hypothetical Protein FCC1311_010642 [Hondaea fermentalgiana]